MTAKTQKSNIDMKNIKRAKTGGYQIQFIVNGKSHSGFSMDLSEAVKIRDKMRKELNIIPNGAFKKKSSKYKKSLIPGTKQLMHVGITFTSFVNRGYETYYILVNWKDYQGKQKCKSFYCGKESTYTVKRGKEIYKHALKFRKAYEKAVLDGTLRDFDPTLFNISNTNNKTGNKSASKPEKSSNRLLKRRRMQLRRR